MNKNKNTFCNSICNDLLCDCCKDQCKLANSFNPKIKYLKTDKIPDSIYCCISGKRAKSVDCIRTSNYKSNRGRFILVEIKNSPMKNLTCEDIEEQLKGTIMFLKKNYYETLKNGILFFLAVSPEPTKNPKSIKQFKTTIEKYKFDKFDNSNYKLKEDSITYTIPSRVITCPLTETLCL
jgi:hypothetical protein